MSAWTAFWLVWMAAGGTAEAVALGRRAPHDTLSEQVWAWLHVTPGQTTLRTAVQSWRAFAVAGFLFWLIPHFTLGWWT